MILSLAEIQRKRDSFLELIQVHKNILKDIDEYAKTQGYIIVNGIVTEDTTQLVVSWNGKIFRDFDRTGEPIFDDYIGSTILNPEAIDIFNHYQDILGDTMSWAACIDDLEFGTFLELLCLPTELEDALMGDAVNWYFESDKDYLKLKYCGNIDGNENEFSNDTFLEIKMVKQSELINQ